MDINEQIRVIRERFAANIEKMFVPGVSSTDIPVVYVKKVFLSEFLVFLKTEPGFEYRVLSDLTAVDNGSVGALPRFDVVYNLFSLAERTRLRVKVRVGDQEDVPSVVKIWPAANWAEREVWDMFGIRFTGHPDLRRILMDDRWRGHPLRKDYDLRDRQIFDSSQPVNIEKLMGDNDAAGGLADEMELNDASMIINIGTVHPSMHGSLRVVARINGETIENSYSELGYTHRAKEKLGENKTYHQFMVYTDRLNYCSSLANNVAYAMAVERLLGVDVPSRAVWLRMICCEISRVIDHLVCVGINAVDMGAFTYFLFGFQQREEAYALIERLCGARLTTSYVRVGGLMADAPDGWEKSVRAWAQKTKDVIKEMDRLLTANRIWYNRTRGVGVFGKEQCLDYGFTGPNARAAGIDLDLRREPGCMFYRELDFEVPLGEQGDVFDRYAVRMEEMRQSLAIIEQCCERLSRGPVWADDKRVAIPEKERVYKTMEGLIHQFKFFMNGFDVPAGEAYSVYEAPNGELGFYIISKGGPKAHRMRIRGPSFYHYQGIDLMIRGGKIADAMATVGSVNIIAGELDR
jgi:NADH dehydrogenase I D subunit